MHPVLRPGLGVFRRDPRHLQLGLGAGVALVLEDRPGLLELLRLLDGRRDLGTVACLAHDRVDSLDAAPEELVAALESAGLVVDAETWNDTDAALRPEIRSLTARGLPAADAQDRMVLRTRSRIEVRGDPATRPLLTETTKQLSALGIDTVDAPASEVTAVLVVAQGGIERGRLQELHYEHTPYLVVGVDGGVAHIGPFVHPGTTPCVECCDRRRFEWDPSWRAIVPQLGSPLVRPAQSGLSATTRATAAAVVAEELATYCDELEPLTASQLVALGPGAHDRTESAIERHPDCGCH